MRRTPEQIWLKKNAVIGKTTPEFRRLLSSISISEDHSVQSYCPTCKRYFTSGDVHEAKAHAFITGHATVIEKTKQTIITKKK